MSAFLSAVRRRLRVAWGFATGEALAPGVAAVALVLVAIGFRRPWWWLEPLALGVGGAAVVALAVWALLLRVPDTVAARAADRGLATKDAFATALQLRAAPEEGLNPLVLARAEGIASGATAAEAVPLRWRRRRLALAGVVVAGTLGLGFAPNRQDEVRAAAAAEQAAIDDIANDLREQAAAIAADPASSDAERAEAEALARLAEELDRAGTLEDAEAALAEARAELADEVSAARESQRAAAVGLDRSLAAEPLPGAAADAPASEQLDAAADALAELTPEEQAALAEQLGELAEGQAVANPALADALAAAAAALEAGDVAGAQAALGEAAAAQAAATSSVAAQDAAADGAARISDALAQLGQLGQGRGQGQGQGQGQGEGQGDGDGDGDGNGNGNGNGSGSGSGQGQGAGSGASGQVGGTSASTGSGRGGVGTPDGSGNNPSTGLDTSGDEITVYDPGDILDSGGSNSGNDPGVTTGRGNGASGSGFVTVPQSELGVARDAAGRALERADITPSQRDLVRAYFDNIANGGPR